jgi:hypothetical protein
MSRLNPIAVLHEPLIQFFILAAIVFAVDAYVVVNRDDPRNIIIDDKQVQGLIDIFSEGQGRAPSASELSNMIIKWSQNEILYREARQLEMDNGDEMIRSRLVLKMRNVLFNRVVVDTPNAEELQSFFEFNRKNYDIPLRYDFEQFLLTDIDDEQQAAALARSIGNGAVPEQYAPLFRRYQQRPITNLTALFGEQTTNKIIDAKGAWVSVKTDSGIHLARISQHYEAQPATLDEIKSLVIRDWKKFNNDIQLADQTKAIADRYRIELDLSDELSAKLDSPKVLKHGAVSSTPTGAQHQTELVN